MSVLLSLTEEQEAQVRRYLDDALGQLERDARKHRLAPLSDLVARLSPVLTRILQIPPVEPWASTRVQYFLRFTANSIDYITSLPLMVIPEGMDDQEAEDAAGDTMALVLEFIESVECGWLAVLGGNGYSVGPGWPLGDQSLEAEEDVSGGAGADQTARVRLWGIVTAARERMIAWARPYGQFPGEVMDMDGDEWEEPETEEERVGWESQILRMWGKIMTELIKEVKQGDTMGSSWPGDL